jgi:Tn3 transposase DDE domain
MEEQLGALGLVLNCIVLWNTFYMNAALEQLRAEGYPVRDEDLARLSPFVRHHLGVHGRPGRRSQNTPQNPCVL